MYPAIVKVSPKEDFTLVVAFDNGQEGVLDMKPYLDFGVFRRLRDLAEFQRVRVSFDTIQWDCGADLDPEFVHSHCKIVSSA